MNTAIAFLEELLKRLNELTDAATYHIACRLAETQFCAAGKSGFGQIVRNRFADR